MATSEDMFALATALEAEEILGEGEEVLSAEDIFAVLEILEEHGVDLTPAIFRSESES